jgi:transcriptional regulator
MLIHPWDGAVDSMEWRHWLNSNEKFGILIVNNIDSTKAPIALPTHFTIFGDEILLHFAKPNQAWKHIEAATEVRLAVTNDYAYIPSKWRLKAGGIDEDGVPTSYYTSVQFTCRPSVIDDEPGKEFILNEQLKDMQPNEAPTVSRDEAPYGRMLPGIRGLRLAIIDVEAKFKYDDHNPLEHRERVNANLEARNRGSDKGAAKQQRRRLGVVGEWAMFRDK